MSMTGARLLLASLAVALLLAGCTEHRIYRPGAALCVSPTPGTACETNAVQEYRAPAHADAGYLLGFVEFDDQGQLWDRKQMRTVIDTIYQQSGDEDVLVITFVHGWKHSASNAPEDTNITSFRGILERVSEIESRTASDAGVKPRKVFGVYLGWRGGSVTAPVLKELTFWDRKATAQKVGHVGVAEVLARLELVKATKDAVRRKQLGCVEACEADRLGEPPASRTRLVVVGHSFGGALVHAAISQLLEHRFVLTGGAGGGVVTNARGYGDLVVLINPAFEANLFASLGDMAAERGFYFTEQRPVLAVLTSEADLATKIAFPLGRSISTFFENERVVSRYNAATKKTETIDQHDGNVTTIGHFEPYRTHDLQPAAAHDDGVAPTVATEMATMADVMESWRTDKPGGEIAFPGTVLQRTTNSAARNPYLVIRVSKDLIPDHNDIYDERVTAFLRGLILMTIR
jgi:pimeloyl-ACP methyl ester carboxylesterase